MIMDYEFKVVSGQLVLLPKALSDQVKRDVLNTQLYAQLYASAKAKKFSDPIVWDKRLTNARSELKWFTRFTLSQRPEPVDEAEINTTSLIMEQFARAPHFDLVLMEDAVRRGLSALACSSPAHKVFFDSTLRVMNDDSSLKPQTVSDVFLNVSVVSPEAHMIDVQVSFSALQLLDEHFLEQGLEGKDIVGSISLSVSEFELDTSAFSSIRDKVMAGLGGAEATQIVNLDVPSPAVITVP